LVSLDCLERDIVSSVPVNPTNGRRTQGCAAKNMRALQHIGPVAHIDELEVVEGDITVIRAGLGSGGRSGVTFLRRYQASFSSFHSSCLRLRLRS
jgi:hypothetical protein